MQSSIEEVDLKCLDCDLKLHVIPGPDNMIKWTIVQANDVAHWPLVSRK